MKSHSESYAASGVDIEAGYRAVELMKKHVATTKTDGVLSDIGGFGAGFLPNLTGMKAPVLVSGTDGVGTKLKLSFLMDKHDTIGIDCVAMCVNDIVCSGARPLFFLDYIACGKNYPEKIEQIVKGVSEGCVASGCALIGGETAEHPQLMPEEEYDLAGFAVGLADKARMIDGSTSKENDVLIALPSSGVHSNGFSLVRKVFAIDEKGIEALEERPKELNGASVGETLLTPTRIYVKAVLALMEQVSVKGIAHITGGGFYENIPRSIPEGLSAVIDRKAWEVPAIFSLLAARGNIDERDMFNTFNMGVGMTITVAPEDVDKAVSILHQAGENAFVIGTLKKGEGGVIF